MDHYSYSMREKPRHRSRRRRSSGGTMGGMMEQWGSMYMEYMDEMTQMWQEAMSPLTEMFTPSRERSRRRGGKHRHHHHHHDCGCDDCCGDGYGADCHCLCCIGDADLVVYARLGERRVVPIEIENSRRREREIRLELSGWSSRGGRPANISGQLVPPTEFTLGACDMREVLLLVNATTATGDVDLGKVVEAQRGEEVEAQQQEEEGRRLPDVDDCEVLYADLRVEGCDIRPIRIALVLLPRDCDPYEIECSCGCC